MGPLCGTHVGQLNSSGLLSLHGGTISLLSYDLARQLLEWMKPQDIRVSASYIPRKRNLVADLVS